MRNTRQILQQHGFFCGKVFYTEKSNFLTETSDVVKSHLGPKYFISLVRMKGA